MPKARSPAPQLDVLRAKDRGVFRRWLERHHAKKSAVLLVYAKKGSGKASI